MTEWLKSYALAWCVIIVATVAIGEFMYWGKMPWVGDWSVGTRAFYAIEAVLASLPVMLAVHQIRKALK